MIKPKKLLLICFLSVVIANNPLRVDHKRLNNNFIILSKISSVDFGNLSRVAYTDADIDGRKYVMQLMKSAGMDIYCLLYTSPSPRDLSTSRMPSSA